MNSRKVVFSETALVAIGEAVCVGLMLGVFALLDRWNQSVWLGGIVGGLAAIANFFFMAVTTSLATDRAAAGNVKSGQGLLTASFLLRYVALFVVLLAAVKSGYCDVFAVVIPLVFVRPVLTIGEFFRKKGDAANG